MLASHVHTTLQHILSGLVFYSFVGVNTAALLGLPTAPDIKITLLNQHALQKDYLLLKTVLAWGFHQIIQWIMLSDSDGPHETKLPFGWSIPIQTLVHGPVHSPDLRFHIIIPLYKPSVSFSHEGEPCMCHTRSIPGLLPGRQDLVTLLLLCLDLHLLQFVGSLTSQRAHLIGANTHVCALCKGQHARTECRGRSG